MEAPKPVEPASQGVAVTSQVEPSLITSEATGGSSEPRSDGAVEGGVPDLVAQAEEGRVLALGDLTFMTEPYHTVRDNSRLILHIADFLTGAERSYVLADFPRFFGMRWRSSSPTTRSSAPANSNWWASFRS